MKTRTRVVAVASLVMCATGCAQNLRSIVVPHPDAATAQSKCGVVATALVSRAQCLCLAKVSGLEAGGNKWQVHEYDDYVDVFNTTSKHPIEHGLSVRIRRQGGAIIDISPWEAITVRNGPSNPALEPTPVGRVRVRRVPALGGILPRAARLNASR